MKNVSVGSLLEDKNALINYIYLNNEKIGAVVGMRGKDRNNPLVGWCLFDELEGYENNFDLKPIKDIDAYKTMLWDLETAINCSECASLGKSAFDKLKEAKVIVNTSILTEEIKYKTVELAILRANSNHNTFFVCSNPAYNQNYDVLKPYKNDRHKNFIMIKDHFVYDDEMLSAVRHSVRAMEYRCWRYFKDVKETD